MSSKGPSAKGSQDAKTSAAPTPHVSTSHTDHGRTAEMNKRQTVKRKGSLIPVAVPARRVVVQALVTNPQPATWAAPKKTPTAHLNPRVVISERDKRNSDTPSIASKTPSLAKLRNPTLSRAVPIRSVASLSKSSNALYTMDPTLATGWEREDAIKTFPLHNEQITLPSLLESPSSFSPPRHELEQRVKELRSKYSELMDSPAPSTSSWIPPKSLAYPSADSPSPMIYSPPPDKDTQANSIHKSISPATLDRDHIKILKRIRAKYSHVLIASDKPPERLAQIFPDVDSTCLPNQDRVHTLPTPDAIPSELSVEVVEQCIISETLPLGKSEMETQTELIPAESVDSKLIDASSSTSSLFIQDSSTSDMNNSGSIIESEVLVVDKSETNITKFVKRIDFAGQTTSDLICFPEQGIIAPSSSESTQTTTSFIQSEFSENPMNAARLASYQGSFDTDESEEPQALPPLFNSVRLQPVAIGALETTLVMLSELLSVPIREIEVQDDIKPIQQDGKPLSPSRPRINFSDNMECMLTDLESKIADSCFSDLSRESSVRLNQLRSCGIDHADPDPSSPSETSDQVNSPVDNLILNQIKLGSESLPDSSVDEEMDVQVESESDSCLNVTPSSFASQSVDISVAQCILTPLKEENNAVLLSSVNKEKEGLIEIESDSRLNVALPPFALQLAIHTIDPEIYFYIKDIIHGILFDVSIKLVERTHLPEAPVTTNSNVVVNPDIKMQDSYQAAENQSLDLSNSDGSSSFSPVFGLDEAYMDDDDDYDITRTNTVFPDPIEDSGMPFNQSTRGSPTVFTDLANESISDSDTESSSIVLVPVVEENPTRLLDITNFQFFSPRFQSMEFIQNSEMETDFCFSVSDDIPPYGDPELSILELYSAIPPSLSSNSEKDISDDEQSLFRCLETCLQDADDTENHISLLLPNSRSTAQNEPPALLPMGTFSFEEASFPFESTLEDLDKPEIAPPDLINDNDAVLLDDQILAGLDHIRREFSLLEPVLFPFP